MISKTIGCRGTLFSDKPIPLISFSRFDSVTELLSPSVPRCNIGDTLLDVCGNESNICVLYGSGQIQCQNYQLSLFFFNAW